MFDMIEEKKDNVETEDKELINRIKEVLSRTDIEIDEKIQSIKENDFISAGIDRLLKKNAIILFKDSFSYNSLPIDW